MPSSRPHTVPIVVHLLRQIKPQSILDVGVGFGKWGHLFREYTDIIAAERDPGRYRRENWKVRIDGIEGHAAYLTEMHRFLYNDIHLGDACAILPRLPDYDLIFMGDIIEHLDKEQGRQLLRDALAKAKKAIIVSTPEHETGQEDLCGNELERHRSLWSARDFRAFAGARVCTIEGATLLALIAKPGLPPLSFKRAKPKPADLRRLRKAKEQISRMIPQTDRFILVDEEQIRGSLAHRAAMPFTERDGQYWGPPADDEAAIGELERLRAAGARCVAFVWSTFWWLDHYSKFREYLNSNFQRIWQDDTTVIFDLTK